MMSSLPYPGHTWSFTQHAVGLDSKTLYDFLKCAAPFEGQTDKKYRAGITNVMLALNILTPNIRGDVPDAWRDYQQILAELGLIYSTTISKELFLTEIGHLYLAGEIGFSELIGIQALRYQYPNGQKSTIQSRLRKVLNDDGITVPETLTELQVNNGILLKPGTLILRILIELYKSGETCSLTASECQTFLIPCKQNSDWHFALAGILSSRSTKNGTSINTNRHSRRNIQDWFKFLSKSDILDLDDNGSITLSTYSFLNIPNIELCCHDQENISSFWIPQGYDIQGRKSWFNWFGSLNGDAQQIIRTDISTDIEYIEKNYISGSIDNEQDEFEISNTTEINLQELDINSLVRSRDFNFSSDFNKLVENLKKGAEKRHAKTVLHDAIIKRLAESFLTQGAKVESDSKTIDLFAAWPSGETAIFEVKTVTRKSLQNRLRLAIGQIEEYSYRRKLITSEDADKVIVVNTIIEDSAWQKNLLIDHLGIGLICSTNIEYKAYAPDKCVSRQHWV